MMMTAMIAIPPVPIPMITITKASAGGGGSYQEVHRYRLVYGFMGVERVLRGLG